MPAFPSTILVAPDSFKGTLSASRVAAAVARGLREGGWEAEECPVADGGEGTLDALAAANGLRLERATVGDPLGRPVRAAFGIADNGVAVVEAATASGLGLIAEHERDAEAASSAGTGELVLAAVAAGAREVIVAAGGSATTDGGLGAIEAIAAGGGLGGAQLVVLSDVRTPFEDAARVFAPQKGADPAAVARLTKRLGRLAAKLPRDPRGVAYTGAAGGLAGGLWAAFDARLEPGAPFVLAALDFDRRMRAARAVVVGEGRLDRQTLAGKIAGEIATRARQSGVPCHAVAGASELDEFDARVLDLQTIRIAGTPRTLQRAGRELAELL